MTLRIKRAEEVDNRWIVLQIKSLTSTAQQHKSEEEESDTKEEITKITTLLAIYQHDT